MTDGGREALSSWAAHIDEVGRLTEEFRGRYESLLKDGWEMAQTENAISVDGLTTWSACGVETRLVPENRRMALATKE